jgi:hypothetical protein
MSKNFATLIMALEFFPVKLTEILAKVLRIETKTTPIVEKTSVIIL